jgi:integrase
MPNEMSEDEQERKEKVDFLTPGELMKIIDNVDELKYKVIFLMAASTGLREGELLGLKWSDIDLEGHLVHVRRTFNHGRFYPPKSNKSRRSVDLMPKMVSELRRWKLASSYSGDDDLVFPGFKGGPMDCNHLVKKRFYPALNRAEIKKIRFHSLRHTFASLLIDQGENIKYIQEKMGHASITTTLDIYGHLMNKTNREAAKRLQETIFG